MSSTDDMYHPPPPRRSTMSENRREREFYRYYEPIRVLSKAGPLFCNVGDPSARRAHKPFSSPDKVLTAFCQLGALRLNSKRAMLFFFDTTHAYILAESTQSLSLQHDETHDGEDGMWLGHSVIPRGFSVCEHTVKMGNEPAAKPGQPPIPPIHIISDLAADTRFCDRPFVLDAPHARFYAGVPITTGAGINIGAFCILDDRVREGISDKDAAFLREMSTTVMDHLEMVRASAERERGALMIAGLGAFVQGESTLRRPDCTPNLPLRQQMTPFTTQRESARSTVPVQPPESPRPGSLPPGERTRSSSEETTRRRSFDDIAPNNSLLRPPDLPSPAEASVQPGADERCGAAVTPTTSTPTTDVRSTGHDRETLNRALVPEGVRSALDRAANLIQEAIHIDGVLFLDASASRKASSNDVIETSSDQGSQTSITAGESSNAEGDRPPSMKQPTAQPVAPKPCFVLGSAFASDALVDGLHRHEDVSERFLKSLLRRHPRGKIWNFDDTGVCSDEDSLSDGSRSKLEPARRADSSEKEGPGNPSPQTTRRQRRSRETDAKELQRIFPGVRHLAVVGVWNHALERWFAACVIWTRSPLRVLSLESEVSYVSAFNDVIMAEVHRLEAQKSDRMKADFISSISHELRSPLHGILGSVEFLQDQPSETVDRSLLAQIESCGRTLLDIIDHLLDYSKINSMIASSANERHKMSGGRGRENKVGALTALDADLSLDKVTEEVTNATIYSFACSRSEETMSQRKVSVILDIDHSKDWACKLSVGAWKRICINLINNALKYTNVGFVHVGLTQTPVPGKRNWFNAVLTVNDSGQGMTKEYMAHHLFEAFSQEDNLAEGTGLGMSLVSTIVKDFGGTIECQSEKGSGTELTITIPFKRYQVLKMKESQKPLTNRRRPFSGKTMGFVRARHERSNSDTELPGPEQTGLDLVLDTTQKACMQLGLQVHRGLLEEVQGSTMLAITEAGLRHLSGSDAIARKDQSASLRGKPVLILCDDVHSERRMRKQTTVWPFSGPVRYIAQPYGPSRLIDIIDDLLASPTHCAIRPDTTMQTVNGQQKLTAFFDQQSDGRGEHMPSSATLDKARGRMDKCASGANGAADSVRSGSKEEANRSGSGSGSATESEMLTSPYVFQRSRSSEARPAPETSPTDASSLPLLLVDDNEINLRLLVTYSRKHKHRATLARDGLQAIEAYSSASEKPRVILMDISMPHCDGFEATRRIRALEQKEKLSRALVIALTGLGSAEAQREAERCGIDLFLTKPVRLRELTSILRGLDSPTSAA